MSLSSAQARPKRAGAFVGLIVFMLVVAAVAILAWIVLLPRVITGSASELTGFPTRLGSLYVNPFTGVFQGKTLVVGNPDDWGGEALAEVGVVSGEVDLLSLRKKTAVFEKLRIEIDRLVVIVDVQGQTNIEAIGSRFSATAPVDPFAGSRYVAAGLFGGGEDPSDFLVEQLDLHIGLIEIQDHGTNPVSQIRDDLDYQHTYTDFRRYEQLITPQLLARLARSPATLRVLLSSGLRGGAGGNSSGGLQQLFDRASGAVNSFLQGLEQTGKP